MATHAKEQIMSRRRHLPGARLSRSIWPFAVAMMITSLMIVMLPFAEGSRTVAAEEAAATPIPDVSGATDPVADSDLELADEPVDDQNGQDIPPQDDSLPAPAAIPGETIGDPVDDSLLPEEPDEPRQTVERQVAPVEIADAALDEGIGTIYVTKVNQFGSPLAGASLEVLQGSTVVDTWVSSEFEGYLVTGLHLEVPYTVREASAPAGCVAGADYTFTLTPDLPSDALTVTNECTAPVPGAQLTVTKVNQTGTLLGGAQFELVQGGTVLDRWVSTRFGGHTISGLMFDVPYTIREVTAPAGCTGVGDQTVTITPANPAPTVTIANECSGTVPLGEISIHKTDQNGNLLAGVEFVAMDGPWVMARGTTGADGWLYFMRLPLDATYTIQEVAPLAGCLPAADRSVTLDASHTFQLFEIVNECPTVDARGEVTVNNLDQDGNLLGAVEFQVVLGDGTVARIGAMPWSGLLTFSDLSLDQPYTVRIVEAPVGCVAAPEQPVLLTAAAPRQDLTFISECTDPALDAGTLNIQVMDQDSLPLPGVQLQLLEAGTEVLDVTSGTSVVRIDRLSLDIPYTVHVVAVPAGCALAPDQTLTLTVENPSRAMAFLIDCDEPLPSPSPTTPDSTPEATPTEATGTPAATPTATSPTLTTTPEPAPGSSTTGTDPGDPPAMTEGNDPASGTLSTSHAGQTTVVALPNTGTMASGDAATTWVVLLATSGMLLITGAGVHLRRE